MREPPSPSSEEIERAWRRPGLPPAYPGAAPFVHGFNRVVWKIGDVFLVIFVLVAIGMTLAAAADLVWRLGWGFAVSDVWMGLAAIVFCGLMYACTRLIRRLVSSITRAVYGPDPREGHSTQRHPTVGRQPDPGDPSGAAS